MDDEGLFSKRAFKTGELCLGFFFFFSKTLNKKVLENKKSLKKTSSIESAFVPIDAQKRNTTTTTVDNARPPEERRDKSGIITVIIIIMSASSSLSRPPRNVLLPVDIANTSEDTCTWACENFFRNADTVVVLTVAKKHTQAHGSSYFGLSHDHSEAEAVQHAHEWIETHIKPHLMKCGCRMEVLVKLLETDKHHVAEAIVEESKKMDANTNSRYYEAIVLASHKRGAIKEFFLGSVAHYVLHHSNVAVIVQKIK